MGQSDAFSRNAETLGIDLSAVDFAILSHGHYDHGGGLEAFLRINQKAPIYIHETAFGDYYNGTEKYIGLDQTLRQHPRLIATKGNFPIDSGLLLSDCNDQNWQYTSWGLNRREGDCFTPDDFCHEQYMQIWEDGKRILISGCSHKGIVNIVTHFTPHVLIGGFHLNKETDHSRLQATAEELLNGQTRFYTGHCTGASQFAALQTVMRERLQGISTGFCFEI